MKIINKITKWVAMGTLVTACALSAIATPTAWAARYRFGVSPMNQKLVLNPGDSFTSTFTIANPGTSEDPVVYNVELENFYVDDDYNTIHEEYGSTGEILDWITIKSPTSGTLEPNETAQVEFTIDVPIDAAAGGQYASFTVTSGEVAEEEGNSEDTSTMINEVMAIAHLLFVEITGQTIHQGEIVSASVPSFLFSGNIAGSSSIKNTGNTYGTATYTLKVFPIFSDEEVYTNEEEPETHAILPDRTFYNETSWNDTPAIGIFNVVYTVEFEGVTTEVSKMVIVCPLWLLFIIIFAIVAIIIYFVMRSKSRKK